MFNSNNNSNRLVIIIVVIIIIIYVYNKIKIEIENFQTFSKCKDREIGDVLSDVLKNNNITRSKKNDDGDLYLPCGYTGVEDELKKMKIRDNLQTIFAIDGCDDIIKKNTIWELLVESYGRGGAQKLMPNTFILNNNDDMNAFKNSFKKNRMYILKKNIQRKKGLKLTNNYSEILNANNLGYKVVQEYKDNLYLINKRKINLRIYLLIICDKTGNVNCYLHRRGKCIYTNKDYDDSVMDFESNITSVNMDLDVYNRNPREFNELKEFLNKNGENGNLLFERIDILMSKVMNAVKHRLCKSDKFKNNVNFQLFGADVIFDKYLYPYLLEINKGPDMIPKDEKDRELKTTVYNDVIKLLMNNNSNDSYGFYKI
jgi:hypothetical protein